MAILSAILANIFTSASKLVFLMVATTVCIAFFTNHLTQENFMWVTQSVMSYYFGKAAGSAEVQQRIQQQVADAAKPPTEGK